MHLLKLFSLQCKLESLTNNSYLAAKIHYFGVGGGIVDFETLVNSDKSFEIVSVHRVMEGTDFFFLWLIIIFWFLLKSLLSLIINYKNVYRKFSSNKFLI